MFANNASGKGLISKIYKYTIAHAVQQQQQKNGQPSEKMGRRPKQTFLQRRHTDGQQTHEKMFNNTDQRNANQNSNKASPHTSQKGNHYHLKNLQITKAGVHVEKREPSYTVGGTVSWCSHYG